MEVRAITKSIRISPRKMRLVAEAIRNMPIEKAYRVLEVTQKRAALVVSKTLKSAVANAVTNANLETKNLYVSQISVNEAQALKRFRPSTRGRIHPYKKRGSHLTIVLKEKVVVAPIASKATVAKKEEVKVKKRDEKKEVKK
ncbi:MAG: 50S ribosomal protein L22 [Candidatus Levyibacteriota bacterium]